MDEEIPSAPEATSEAEPDAGDGPAADERTPADAGSSTGTQTSGPTGGAEPHVPGTPGEPEPIDLLGVPDGAMAKRVVAAVSAVVLVVFLVRWLVRRRRS